MLKRDNIGLADFRYVRNTTLKLLARYVDSYIILMYKNEESFLVWVFFLSFFLFFFFGCNVQQLVVGSQFPGQGSNPVVKALNPNH